MNRPGWIVIVLAAALCGSNGAAKPDHPSDVRLLWGKSRLESARNLLDSFERGAEVLPAIQRLVWLGNHNHTVVSAGIKLTQLERGPGIPFLPMSEVVRIPRYLEMR